MVPLALAGGGRRPLPTAWIGWANALAAGMMFGAAYSLAEAGLAGPPLPAAIGAAVGATFISWIHGAVGTAAPSLARAQRDDPTHGYRVVLIHTLHSACEGVAIGVAMVVDLRFGIFLALAIAVHNIPEATVLCAALTGRGVRLAEAGGLAVAADLSQVLLAVAAFAVVSAAPAALPWVLGFAVGALVDLVLVELLPESYHEAGQTSIALVASVAMGIVVLLEGVVLP